MNFLDLHPKAAWAQFDAAFYAAAHPAAPDAADADTLLRHYLAEGAKAGASPNRWFDEAFYRSAHPDVERAIRSGEAASGCEHYCRSGYPTLAPHWLFDPAFYAAQNPQLTDDVLKTAGFANGYDHFLKYGDAEGRLCHAGFDPAAYAAGLDPQEAADCAATGAFKHVLTHGGTRAVLQGRGFKGNLANRAMAALAPSPSPLPPEDAGRGLPAPPQRIKIHVDRPRHSGGAATGPIDGHLDIVGWAAADHPVARVDIYLDDEPLGCAHHGIRSEGVAAAFPELSHALFAGFRFIAPSPAPPGRHRLRIVATGEGGLQTAESFTAEFKPALLQEGPWCLRRRMRGSEAAHKTRLIESIPGGPEFIIVFTEGASESACARAKQSLERQVYGRWRVHGGGATARHPGPPRTGEGEDSWLVPLGPGDELGVDALLELALHLAARPAVDFVYSDERRIDPSSGSMAPYFKPDWSPDLLLATDYVGRLWAASAKLAARAGLAEAGLAAQTNHDLVLRLTEQAACIGHVPLVLCESAPRAPDADAVRRALARA
jgi:hypothetical protein